MRPSSVIWPSLSGTLKSGEPARAYRAGHRVEMVLMGGHFRSKTLVIDEMPVHSARASHCQLMAVRSAQASLEPTSQ